MTSKAPLEQLLQMLVNTPEADKGALVHSLLKALREACNMFNQNSAPEYKRNAREIRNILDNILSGSTHLQEEEWEEEFVDSGQFELTDGDETIASSGVKVDFSGGDEGPSDSQVQNRIVSWNDSAPDWMDLPKIQVTDHKSVSRFIKTIAALRWNLGSGAPEAAKYIPKLDELWNGLQRLIEEQGYYISPGKFGTLDNPIGRVIHTCRSRSSASKSELVMPAISFKGEEIQSAVSVMTLPADNEFPEGHPNSDLAAHWRGIFGELELLLQHVDMQSNASCSIEGINKNRVESLDDCRAAVLNELKRRAEVLRGTIDKQDEESLYRLATDYWRVEECFWSIFHDDDRPGGCSYLDRLRNRVQSWRTALRRHEKFHIRDFSCGSDTLASVNKYISNIILRPQKGISPGTVVRELRPAILVKVQSTARVLKGRVIAT